MLCGRGSDRRGKPRARSGGVTETSKQGTKHDAIVVIIAYGTVAMKGGRQDYVVPGYCNSGELPTVFLLPHICVWALNGFCSRARDTAGPRSDVPLEVI